MDGDALLMITSEDGSLYFYQYTGWRFREVHLEDENVLTRATQSVIAGSFDTNSHIAGKFVRAIIRA